MRVGGGVVSRCEALRGDASKDHKSTPARTSRDRTLRLQPTSFHGEWAYNTVQRCD